ncbi:hypothetical protein M9Y10_027974 [Tritrichomonas musculus]|uniref:DNA replication complex GINS protein PSF3 N-terminal domain-containing protein n=1 Tax=Tritrichomonas musculus TaxID=1915356 RepID=A0ABR2KHZ1_9EUKA
MSKEEIDDFLHQEDLVPVTFLGTFEGLGFIVDPSSSNSTIPENFCANIPFWLASILADPKVKMVSIDEPQWLEKLGPGSTITEELSYEYGANIGVVAGKNDTISQLIDLCKSRTSVVINSAFKTTNRKLDRQEPVFMSEENDIIQKTRANYQSFLQWKTGSITV